MLVDAEWDEAILPLGYDAVIGTLKLPRTANHKPWTGVDMDWIGKAGKALNSAEQMFVAISLIRWASWKGYPVEADSEKNGGGQPQSGASDFKIIRGRRACEGRVA
jgi:hypothetical protein